MAHLKEKLQALKAKADKKHGKDIDDLIALAEQIEAEGDAARAEKQAARFEAQTERQKAVSAERDAKELRQKYETKLPRIFSLHFLRFAK